MLLLGHAVPMPITIRTRHYGPELFADAKARAGLSTATTPSERRAETAARF